MAHASKHADIKAARRLCHAVAALTLNSRLTISEMSDANPSMDDDEFTQSFNDIIGAIATQRHIMVMSEEQEIPKRQNIRRVKGKLGDPAFVSQLSEEEIETLREDIVNGALRGRAQSCVRTSLNSVTDNIELDDPGYGPYASVTIEAPESLFDPTKSLGQSLDGVMTVAWDKFNQSLIHQTFGPRHKKRSMRWNLVDCTSSAITSHVLGVENGARRARFEKSMAGLSLSDLWSWCKSEGALGVAAWKDAIKKGDPSEEVTATSQVLRHPLTLDDVEAEITRLSKDLPDFKDEADRRYTLISNEIVPENLTRLEESFREAWNDGTVDHKTWRSTFDLGTILLDREMIDAVTEGSDRPVHEDGLTLAAVGDKPEVTLDKAWPDDMKPSEWDLVTA